MGQTSTGLVSSPSLTSPRNTMTAGWIGLASGALKRRTQVGFINMASMGSVPARAASPDQVCEETRECITNNLSPDPYPDTLTISSSGEANNLYPELMGDYYKSKGEFMNGRPVWKHKKSDAKFYYNHIYQATIGSSRVTG